jgi:hypothetical protein
VLAVWADARDAEHPGRADLHAVRLQSANATPLGAEQRIVETRAHSHSPTLALAGSDVVLAWVEDALPPERRAGTVNVVELDAQAKPRRAPVSLTPAAGDPLSVSLSCVDERCKAGLAVDRGGTAELQVVDMASPNKLATLTDLAESAAQSVSPVLLGNELFYADLAGPQQGRVRRLFIEWK